MRENWEEETGGATLPEKDLHCERLQALSVYQHHCLQVQVHHANLFTELQLESGGLQNSRQEPMVNPIEGLGLIQIDQHRLGGVF